MFEFLNFCFLESKWNKIKPAIPWSSLENVPWAGAKGVLETASTILYSTGGQFKPAHPNHT
jgi:hypothetical protein